MAWTPGFKPWPHWWEASALTTAAPLLPREIKSNGDQMDMIILDFNKAFDKVPHQCLISKLQFYGIQGSTLTWIKSWLTSRSQSVKIDGMCSKSVDVTSGVPQGTVLGPLMFLLFINDMQDDLVCTLRLLLKMLYCIIKSLIMMTPWPYSVT